MATRALARHIFEVDEHRAGDVAAHVLGLAALAGQVPAEVDDPQVGLAEVVVQPLRGDQGPQLLAHPCPSTRVSWQKWTACGCISRRRRSEPDHDSRSWYCPRHFVRSASSPAA